MERVAATPVSRSTVAIGAIVACALWAAPFLFIQYGAQFVPPLQFAGYRFLISGIGIGLFYPLLVRGEGYGDLWRQVRCHWKILLLLGLFQIGVKYAFFYEGVILVPASLGALVAGMGPLLTALVAHFLEPEHPLSRRGFIALVLGFVGLLILTLGRGEMGATGPLALLGIVLIILNALTSSFGDVWVARLRIPVSAVLVSSSSLAFGGLSLLLVGWGIEGVTPLPITWSFLGSLVALCVISAGAFTIWFVLLQKPNVGVAQLNMWKFLIPLLGALFAWVFSANEHPTPMALLGMVVIVAALLVLNWHRSEHR